MFFLNRIYIIGNVGAEPDIRPMNNGSRVARLSVATTETWVDPKTSQPVSRTQWHKVVTFNEKFISIIERFVHKGSRVFIAGQSETRKWTNEMGQDQYITEIVLRGFGDEFGLLDRPPANEGLPPPNYVVPEYTRHYKGSTSDAPSSSSPVDEDFDDDIPF